MNATKDVNDCSVVFDCWQQLKAGILNLRYSFVHGLHGLSVETHWTTNGGEMCKSWTIITFRVLFRCDQTILNIFSWMLSWVKPIHHPTVQNYCLLSIFPFLMPKSLHAAHSLVILSHNNYLFAFESFR